MRGRGWGRHRHGRPSRPPGGQRRRQRAVGPSTCPTTGPSAASTATVSHCPRSRRRRPARARPTTPAASPKGGVGFGTQAPGGCWRQRPRAASPSTLACRTSKPGCHMALTAIIWSDAWRDQGRRRRPVPKRAEVGEAGWRRGKARSGGGSCSSPVRCSTTGMPAASRSVCAGRCPLLVVSSIFTASIPTRRASCSTSQRAPASVR